MNPVARHPNSAVSRFAPLVLLVTILVTSPSRAQTLREEVWVPDGVVLDMAVSGNTLYLGGNFSTVGPASGGGVVLNTTSGAGVQPYPGIGGAVFAVAPDGAGGWFIGGDFTHVRGQLRSNLAQIDAFGNLTSWNPGADRSVSVIEVSGTTVYVAGQLSRPSAGSRATAWQRSMPAPGPPRVGIPTRAGSVRHLRSAAARSTSAASSRTSGVNLAAISQRSVSPPAAPHRGTPTRTTA